MNTWVRRLRGFVGSSAIWGTIWSVVGAGLGIVLGITGSVYPFDARVVFGLAVGMGVFGVVAGASFGMLLSATQGRKVLSGVSSWGAAAVGFAAGSVAPVALGAVGFLSGPISLFLTLSTFTGLTGATVAAITMAVARRAAQEELPPPSATTRLPADLG